MSILMELQADAAAKAIREGKRLDGRKFDEYRKISVETDISKNADGSCRVKIGETEVVCGTKCLPVEPYPDTPNEGSISVGLEMLPIASPEFETGPPQPRSIEMARVVDRGIRESHALDFSKLSIKDGEKVWSIFIDLYTINDSGNFFDACSLAALKALSETRLPKLDDKFQLVKGEYGKKLELARLPLEITFYKVADKIILDPTVAEEEASNDRFTVAVTDDEYLSAFQKGGAGSFSAAEIHQCIETALKKTKEMRKIAFK